MENELHKSTLRNLSALVDFGNLINSSLQTDFILNNLLLTCFGKFHTTKGIVAVVRDGDLNSIVAKGLTKNTIDDFPNLPEKDYQVSVELNEYLLKHKLVHSQEIHSAEKLIGVIFLGERLSGEEYSIEDSKFLQTFLNIKMVVVV